MFKPYARLPGEGRKEHLDRFKREWLVPQRQAKALEEVDAKQLTPPWDPADAVSLLEGLPDNVVMRILTSRFDVWYTDNSTPFDTWSRTGYPFWGKNELTCRDLMMVRLASKRLNRLVVAVEKAKESMADFGEFEDYVWNRIPGDRVGEIEQWVETASPWPCLLCQAPYCWDPPPSMDRKDWRGRSDCPRCLALEPTDSERHGYSSRYRDWP